MNAEPMNRTGAPVREVLLSVENVSLRFGGVKAISDVSFDIRKGEVRASHTYTSNGDYNIVVRVRDSTGKATQLFEQLTIRDLGTPGAQGRGTLANAAGAAAHRQLQARALAARLGHGPTQLLR